MSKDTALLIIDVQNAMFEDSDPVYRGQELLANLQTLLSKARAKDVPVIFVQHNDDKGLRRGTLDWEVHSAIEPKKEDIRIYKETPDSFYKTNLEEVLKQRNIKKLCISGIQSEVCVDTTTRRAFSLGYGITLMTDAHSTWDRGDLTAENIINHHNDVLKWFAELKSTSEAAF